MAHAYTPGLRVTESALLRKVRRLPLPGRIMVQVGQRVRATDIVAATELPGGVTTVNIAREMNCQPNEVPGVMIKQVGEAVQSGDIVAETRSFFGVFHTFVKAPVPGTIESVSDITGQMLLRGQPTPVSLEAYIDGRVTELLGDEGIVIETTGALVQGIIGLGGETYGPLKMLCDGPGQPLTPEMIGEDCAGKVIVGGSYASLYALKRAIEVKAKALVVGGVSDTDVDTLLGYHLGVAVTGHERLGLTLVVTEGFGSIPMAQRSFDLLKARDGKPASVSGATQIRAGVIRPEVIIADPDAEPVAAAEEEGLLGIGSPIRLIREPYFGQLAAVTALPEELQQIPTEAHVRVLKAKLADGSEVTVPRANVELIEQ
jgi:hypothetical protein